MRVLVPFLMIVAPVQGAAALELDCVATLACVSNMGACQETEVPYALRVGDDVGDKVVLDPGDGGAFYEFTRLAGSGGTLLQAAGGALAPDQGAGAMTVFDDFRFVLTRHSRIERDAAAESSDVVAISLLGICAEATR